MICWVCSLLLAMVWVVNAAKPNFLIIVTDDQRPDTIGLLGNSRIDTPNLDWLVQNGITFENFICSNPLCVPSRAEILTGCSGFRNGVLGMRGEKMNSNLILWPAAMVSGGYFAWYSGKWMNDGSPITRGYNETRALFTAGGGTWKKEKKVLGRKKRAITGYRNWTFKNAEGRPELEKGIGLTPLTDKYIADGALEFLRRKTDKPFFLHVNFTGPHDPLVYPTGYEKKYTSAKMQLPLNFLPRHPFDHGNFNGRDERLLSWPRTKADVLDELAVYYAIIDNIDKQVGRMLNQLRSDGRLKNTYVIFTSDHGLAIGSHGLMGKQNMYDHTIRVPFIISGPNLTKGKKTKAFGYLRDMYPTVCELARIKIPETVEAKSLVPVLLDPEKNVYHASYGYFRDVQRMVQIGTWKLIFYPKINRYQLFDLSRDPFEMSDQIKVKANQPRVMRMRKSLLKWFEDQGDVGVQALK